MRVRYVLPFVATVIASAACGGGDSNSTESDSESPVASADTEPSEDASEQEPGPATGEPIEGPVVSLFSTDLGLYAIDRATDAVRDLTMDGVGFTDRENQPIVVGDAAYMLTFRTIDGQFSSNEVGVGKVELASGAGVNLIQLGTDRETDEDPDLTTFELVGGDASTIWVTSSPFADPNDVTYLSLDSSTGAAGDNFEVVQYEVNTEAGSTCSGDFRYPAVVGDSTVIGITGGWPATVDTATGEIEPMVNWCDFDTRIALSDLIKPEELNDYTVTETGDPIPDDQAQRILEVIEPAVSNGSYVEGDGSLWWVFNTSTGYQDGDDFKSASVGGIVEFDLATSSIVNVWPFGADMATYDVGEADDDITSVSALTQADLRMLAGRLWIMDLREDAPLRVLDPATGELTAIVIAKGDGVDFTAATLISSDPESIWLEVARSTITSEEGELRSAQGVKFLDQVDPTTQTFTSSIEEASIIGF